MNAITTPHPTDTIQYQPQRLNDLLDAFLSDMDRRENTKELYKRILRQYFRWVDQHGYRMNEIARPHIIQYKADLVTSGMTMLSVGTYLNAVKRLYKWLEANKHYPNIAQDIQPPERDKLFKKTPLRADQVTRLLDYIKSVGIREHALVNLMTRTALRCIEVSRANIGDITYQDGVRVLMIQGKGRSAKDQLVKLTDKAYLPLVDYLNTRTDNKDADPLFTSRSNNSTGQRMTTRTISGIVKEGLKAIGLNHRTYTAHSLRHTAIVNYRRGGGSSELAQSFARHSSPVTTQTYDAFFRLEDRLVNAPEDVLDTIY